MFTNPITVWFQPLHNKLYGSEHDSNVITDPTKTCSTPTNTRTMLHCLYALPNAYAYRMKTRPYVYQSSISLVLAHNKKGNHSYDEGTSETMDPTNNSSTTTESTHHAQNLNLFFIIHITTGWNKMIMSSGPISGWCGPLHGPLYSYRKGSSE
jgi:hypothetical protein